MKRIVKPPYAFFKTICHQCGCVFEYEYADVDALGSTTRCPHCDHFIAHDAEDNGVIRSKTDE